MSSPLLKIDIDARRMRVTGYVCERLLEDAKGDGGDLTIQFFVLRFPVHLALDAGPHLKVLHLPIHRPHEPKLIQHAWTELGGNALN
jgi:hypothetical protein